MHCVCVRIKIITSLIIDMSQCILVVEYGTYVIKIKQNKTDVPKMGNYENI